MALEGLVDAIEVAGRFLGKLVSDVFIEGLCRRTGFYIRRKFNKNAHPDSMLTALVGLLFWIVVFLTVLVVYDKLVAFIQFDTCLENGGSFDSLTRECNFE